MGRLFTEDGLSLEWVQPQSDDGAAANVCFIQDHGIYSHYQIGRKGHIQGFSLFHQLDARDFTFQSFCNFPGMGLDEQAEAAFPLGGEILKHPTELFNSIYSFSRQERIENPLLTFPFNDGLSEKSGNKVGRLNPPLLPKVFFF